MTKSTELSSQLKEAKTKAIVSAIFKTFSTVYGHKWASILTNSSEEFAHKLWVRCLDNIEDGEYKKALEVSIKIFDFPPSIAEFLRAGYDFMSENEAYEIAKSQGVHIPLPDTAAELAITKTMEKTQCVLNSRNGYTEKEARRIFVDQYRKEVQNIIVEGVSECDRLKMKL